MIVLRADYLKYFFYTYLISFSTLIFLYTNNRIKILDLNECYHAKINLSIRLKKKESQNRIVNVSYLCKTIHEENQFLDMYFNEVAIYDICFSLFSYQE